MSVQFTQHPQQVVHIVEDDDNGNQHLQSPRRVALDRMTSRSDMKQPYAQVQEQLTQVQLDSYREERTERERVKRIFMRVRRADNAADDSFAKFMKLLVLVRHQSGWFPGAQ
jgi:hypothetical protein